MNIINKPLIFLGLPFSNFSMQETVQRIIEFIDLYKQDLQPRYVTTLKADFLMYMNTWNYGETRFPELLHILRQAHMVTIDASPILWACRRMGSQVKKAVTGADLLSKLAEACSENKKSLFLLGGNEKTIKICVLYLQALYPSLIIAGSAFPQIDVNGEELENAATRDSLLIEQINRSNADVLLINLGHPEQEIWYERVSHELHVPVSIGMWGAFDLLAGVRSGAPDWMHKLEPEKPRYLWKSYFLDLFKFPYMVVPVLFFHNLSRMLYRLFYQPKGGNINLENPLLFISSHSTMALFPLPSRLNASISNEIKNNLDDLFSQDALIFDLKKVRHLDLEGIRLLLHISQRAIKENKQFFMINVSKDITLLLKLHRVWDAVSQNYCHYPKDILARLHKNEQFYDAIQQEQNHVIITFFGRLDHTHNYDEYLKKIKPIIHQKECILDFRYCTYIDNTGFQFLLKLKELRKEYYISLKICGLTKSLKRQFAMTNVLHLFDLIS